MKTKKNKLEFINKITIKLTSYEKERKQRILKLVRQQIILLVITYCGYKGSVVFLMSNHTFLSVICGVIAMIAVILFFWNFSEQNKQFKKYLKQKCKKNILKYFDLDTINGEEFSKELLRKSNLFSVFNKTEYDDVIEGSHNGVEYTIAECKLISEGRKSEFTVFNGVIVSFNSNKKISAETLVTTKGDNNIRNYPVCKGVMIYIILCCFLPFVVISIALISMFSSHIKNIQLLILHSFFDMGENLIIWGILAGILFWMWWKQKKKMQDVKLEDTNFEKRFNVFTKDQVEARYLLTPSFMERLKNLETAFGTKGIKCSFFDEQIMFAIPTNKDLFELGSLYKPLGSGKPVEEFYDELSSIQNMIDHFRFTEKTGL